MGYLLAFREPNVAGYQQVLFALTAAGLVDAWPRAHVAVREVALALLRGGAVAALFVAGLNFGPADPQIQASAQDALAGLLLGVLVLVAQARRASGARQEQRAAAERLDTLATELRAMRTALHDAPREGASPHPAPALSATGALAAGAGLAVLVALVRRRR